MKIYSKFAMAVCLSTFGLGMLASSAHAADDKQGWVGAMFGLSVPSASNTSSRGMFGITGGAKMGSNLGFGAYYLTSSKDETTLGTFGYDLYGVELGYYFDGEATGVYFGGRLGLSKAKSGSGTAAVSTSPSNYGVFGGYNDMITDFFSLGGDLSFFSIPGSSATAANGSTTNIDSFTMLNFMATAKFWF